MFRYSAFAGVLLSELEFPELAAATQQEATWTLRVSDDAAPSTGTEGEIGIDEVEPGVPVRLFQQNGSWVLRYADVGDYVIDPRAHIITWHRKAGALDFNARLDILGRVFATALHATGCYVLHGGSVAIGGRAVAFVAPKHAGKSTLVAQLVAAGAQFVSDDSLPVSLDPTRTTDAALTVLPCGKSIRLLNDSFAELRQQSTDLSPRALGDVAEKPSLLVSEGAVRASAAPLDAIYVLAPNASSERAPANTPVTERERLSGPQATMELIRHSKLGPLLGGSMGTEAMERAVTVANTVPVFRLRVPRDFSQTPRVVAQFFEWHGSRPA